MRTSILGLGNDLRFFLYRRPVSMGKGIEALRGLVVNEIGMDPMDGSVYIFVSKNHKEMKLLHYDRGVFTLYTRKIYSGRFVYPLWDGETDTFRMDWRRLRRLLCGYSIRSKNDLFN